MDPGRREERRVDGVIGMVVTKHDVGHGFGRYSPRGELAEQSVTRGDETGIDDDHPVPVLDQGHGAADVLAVGLLAGVARLKDVHRRGTGQRNLSVVHER